MRKRFFLASILGLVSISAAKAQYGCPPYIIPSHSYCVPLSYSYGWPVFPQPFMISPVIEYSSSNCPVHMPYLIPSAPLNTTIPAIPSTYIPATSYGEQKAKPRIAKPENEESESKKTEQKTPDNKQKDLPKTEIKPEKDVKPAPQTPPNIKQVAAEERALPDFIPNAKEITSDSEKKIPLSQPFQAELPSQKPVEAANELRKNDAPFDFKLTPIEVEPKKVEPKKVEAVPLPVIENNKKEEQPNLLNLMAKPLPMIELEFNKPTTPAESATKDKDLLPKPMPFSIDLPKRDLKIGPDLSDKIPVPEIPVPETPIKQVSEQKNRNESSPIKVIELASLKTDNKLSVTIFNLTTQDAKLTISGIEVVVPKRSKQTLKVSGGVWWQYKDGEREEPTIKAGEIELYVNK